MIDFEKVERELRDGTIQKLIEDRLLRVEHELDSKGIEHHREEKYGWGTIIVFEINSKKVHCNGFTRNYKLDVYYYSDKYSCRTCKLKF